MQDTTTVSNAAAVVCVDQECHGCIYRSSRETQKPSVLDFLQPKALPACTSHFSISLLPLHTRTDVLYLVTRLARPMPADRSTRTRTLHAHPLYERTIQRGASNHFLPPRRWNPLPPRRPPLSRPARSSACCFPLRAETSSSSWRGRGPP